LLGASANKLGIGGHYTYHDHLSLSLRAKYTTKAEGLALQPDGTQSTIFVPNYFNLDLNLLAHDLSFGGVKWDVSFSIYNITGRKNYYSNTIGSNPYCYLAEGREFFGKLTIYY
jgi:TonB dependent receptor